MPEEAAETTIRLVYRSYYVKMGGTGTPPRIEPAPKHTAAPMASASNIMPFRRTKPPVETAASPQKKSGLPVALIFLGLVAIVVLVRYLI